MPTQAELDRQRQATIDFLTNGSDLSRPSPEGGQLERGAFLTPEGPGNSFDQQVNQAMAEYGARIKNPRVQPWLDSPQQLDSELFAPLRQSASNGVPAPYIAPADKDWEVIHTNDGIFRVNKRTGDVATLHEAKSSRIPIVDELTKQKAGIFRDEMKAANAALTKTVGDPEKAGDAAAAARRYRLAKDQFEGLFAPNPVEQKKNEILAAVQSKSQPRGFIGAPGGENLSSLISPDVFSGSRTTTTPDVKKSRFKVLEVK